MSEISNLEPQCVWQIFDLICSIPHISKHEAALAEKLVALTENAGLQVFRDAIGNVIINRNAAPGWENAPKTIIQAHIDMVPASDGDFDFINTPITPKIDGEYVRACGTSLGADDGIGAAHALAVILDKDFNCGALRVILTVDEETGMTGASELDAEFLNARYLLNLDGSDHGFCIGCAGGARQEITFEAAKMPAIPGTPVKITVSGLPGGHSGTCIHENRGNALKIIAEFLDTLPEVHAAEINGGVVDNAIPESVEAWAVSEKSPEELQKLADAFTVMTAKEYALCENLSIRITPAETPEMIWTPEFQQNLLNSMMLVPNGALEFDDTLKIVKTSSNLAVIKSSAAGDNVFIRTSQRSLVDDCRDTVCEVIRTHFELFSGKSAISGLYPATPPKMDSPLLKTAIACARKHGRSELAYAVHAGLESGWFSVKNPALEIISTGPDYTEFHTPQEKVRIASVAEFDTFLRDLLRELGR